MSIVIAGIHTGIGKTVCSAIICQASGYDYFKPVQAGELNNTDSMFVRNIVTNSGCKVHEEVYKLKLAASPHYAAKQEGIEIKKEKIKLPLTQNNLVIETAGGLMSPLAKDFLNIDLAEHFNLPVVLVSNNYLGSINHTLLSFEALKNRNIKMCGIIFNGTNVPASEEYILEYTRLPLLFSIPQFEKVNADTIRKFAKSISVAF
jgi:dethiobiotin synthetase